MVLKFQDVGTYDHKPEMSAAGVGEKVWAEEFVLDYLKNVLAIKSTHSFRWLSKLSLANTASSCAISLHPTCTELLFKSIKYSLLGLDTLAFTRPQSKPAKQQVRFNVFL